MQKRNTKQRRHFIVQAIQSRGELSVDKLAEEYETSEVTIRKDLATLEEAGLLMRRYGGAVALPQEVLNTSGSENVSNRKLNIAEAAAKLIRDHNRIIIDSGTTTRAMIPHMGQVRGLVVMTNSLSVGDQLRELENEPTLLLTGGTWDKRSESFQGMFAEKMLREYNFDQLFIGADGLDIQRGTTTYNEFTALSKTMAEVSREVVVLAESAKLMRKIPNLELAWSDIDKIITDEDIATDDKAQIESQGVEIICVNGLNKE